MRDAVAILFFQELREREKERGLGVGVQIGYDSVDRERLFQNVESRL